MPDIAGSFSAMLRQALGSRVDPAAASFVDMLAEDGVMEFPFSYPGLPGRLQGREAVAAHLERLGAMIAFTRIGSAAVIATTDPDTVVLEFDASGRGIATGEAYEQRYISVIRTHNGRIVHYTDYWNPLAILQATLGAQPVAALVSRKSHHA